MSNFLEGLRQRAAALAPKPEPTATSAVKHDRFDAANWDSIRNDVPAVRDLVDDLARDHDYVEDLAGDFYQLVAKAAPQLEDAADLKQTHRAHRAVVAKVQDSPELEILSTYTVGDPYASAMGLVSMSDGLRSAADKIEQARQYAADAEAKRQRADDAANGCAMGMPVPGAEPSQEELDALAELIAKAEQAAADAAEAEETAEQAAQGAATQAANDLRSAAKQAAEDRQAEEEATAAFGIGASELKRMDFNERRALAQRLSRSRLAKFASMVGQFRQLQTAEQRRRVKHVPDELSNVTLGDELQRMMTTEMLNLAAEETEDDFWMRYASGQLLVQELTGTEKLGQGPIIVVCDESGSMLADLYGATREAWSKAFALALCQQAKTQGRDFTYIGFANSFSQRQVDMPNGDAPLDKVLDMTETFLNGGTSYEEPLRQALALVEDAERRGKPKPDIVFITDEDYGSLDESFVHEWNKVKDRTSMRCFGIAIGTRGKINGALTALGDNNRAIGDVTEGNPREVADIFRTI